MQASPWQPLQIPLEQPPWLHSSTLVSKQMDPLASAQWHTSGAKSSQSLAPQPNCPRRQRFQHKTRALEDRTLLQQPADSLTHERLQPGVPSNESEAMNQASSDTPLAFFG